MTFALLRAESLMFKLPVRNPVAAGAEITPMVQLSPVSSVLGRCWFRRSLSRQGRRL
jgi:hypothetical protein